jgi:hypothetical protein
MKFQIINTEILGNDDNFLDELYEDAYKKYINSLFYNLSGKVKGYVVHEHLTREEFIHKIKTSDEFAKKNFKDEKDNQ